MSCLFDALSFYIENVDGQTLRTMISEYLQQDPLFFDEKNRLSSVLQMDDQPMSLDAYVQNMKQSSTWGGAIEIRAFCELFRARVLVKILDPRHPHDVIEFLPHAPPDSTVEVGYTGNHYIPIRIS